MLCTTILVIVCIQFISFLISGRKFSEADAFIGYQTDTSAEVVFQATEELRRLKVNSSSLPLHTLGGIQPTEIAEESSMWKVAVSV